MIGIELCQEAVEDAKVNATLNGEGADDVSNDRFKCHFVSFSSEHTSKIESILFLSEYNRHKDGIDLFFQLLLDRYCGVQVSQNDLFVCLIL